MTPSPVLKVEGLLLQRGGKRLAGPLDLQLQPGQRALLRGGNGSGKTTFMHTLAGLLATMEGSVQVQGRIGYGMQEPRFPGAMRCGEYLRQLHALSGAGLEECRTAVVEALGRFQLEGQGGRRIDSLSRGWRQRLNLARAWLGTPELILLDEPQTALDPAGMETLAEAVAQASHAAILIVAPEGVGCDALAPEVGRLGVEQCGNEKERGGEDIAPC